MLYANGLASHFVCVCAEVRASVCAFVFTLRIRMCVSAYICACVSVSLCVRERRREKKRERFFPRSFYKGTLVLQPFERRSPGGRPWFAF